MMPVCTIPRVARLAQAVLAWGSEVRLAQGASRSTPVTAWISAIRCGGTPVRRLMISAATAYNAAAPSASATPPR